MKTRTDFLNKYQPAKDNSICFNIFAIQHGDKDDSILDVEEEDERDYPERYKIQLFGIDKDGFSIHVDVKGFTPYFFVEIPQYWKQNHVSAFIQHINKQVNGTLLVDKCKMFEKEKLIGFTNHTKFKFVRLVFDSFNHMKKCSYIFGKPFAISGILNKAYKFNLYESNMEPVLRFLHIKDIDPTGWVRIKKYEEMNPEYSNCQRYIQCK
jgi:DNA polymerase elongation subunit (family B)